MPSIPRRKLLQFSGVVCLCGVAGCVGNAIDPGTLVITNNDDRPHTCTVTIIKTSDSDEDVPPRPHEAPGPTRPPHWQRDFQFEIPAGADRTQSDFLTEPGAYYIKATTETGPSDTNWLGLYSAGSDGEQVAESFIAILIFEDASLTVSTPTDD